MPFLLSPKMILIVIGGLVFVIGCFVALFVLLSSRGVTGVGWDVALFLAGSVVGGLVVAIWHIATVGTGAAFWFLGSESQRDTGKVFQVLGPSWHVVHGVPFIEGPAQQEWVVDVDHVAVGPTGVLVVETKFHSAPLDLGAERPDKPLRDDAYQANRNAQRIRNLLREIAPQAIVVPILVYWGRLVARPPNHVRQLGPVQVVHGSDAKQWIPMIIDRPPELDQSTVERIIGRLQEQ